MPEDAELFEIKNLDGYVKCELYRAESDRVVICMHGAGGGTHGPGNLYHPLAIELRASGISSLLIDCRYDSDLEQCVSDVRACIDYLDDLYHMNSVALVGWSFGGAVVISAAAHEPRVKTVVTISSQSRGAEEARAVAPRPLLIVHGTADRTLPYRCSEDIARNAGEPKKLVLMPDADHCFTAHKQELFTLVRDWLQRYLTRS
jgi:dienelactone hydrolase